MNETDEVMLLKSSGIDEAMIRRRMLKKVRGSLYQPVRANEETREERND